MSTSELYVHGEWPDLNGQACEGLVVEEYWYQGALYDPANVTWLRADATWYRLVFDHGDVFWQVSNYEPMGYELPEVRGSTRLLDLGRDQGFLGEVISRIDGQPTDKGVEVVVEFQSGRFIRFSNVDEPTTYHTG